MPGRAAKILITEKQQDILQTITRSTTVSKRLAQRALRFRSRQQQKSKNGLKLR